MRLAASLVLNKSIIRKSTLYSQESVNALTDFADVQIVNPQNGQELVYRNGKWVNE
jgi:hypothetical protein